MAVQESVVRVARRRRRTPPVPALDQKRLVLSPLPPALESLFGLIAEPALKLEASPDGQRTLREIGIVLADVLDLLEEDPAISRAADRLYEAAFELQDARAHQHTCLKFTER